MRSRNCSASAASSAHLFLLDEHREHRPAPLRAWITNVRAPGWPNAPAPIASTGSNSMASVMTPSRARARRRASGSGTRSARPPVSLHFTSSAPYAWKSNTVTDAGLTCRRWNRSRCMPRVVRDRRLDRVGVAHDHDRLVRVRGDDRVERVDHARLHRVHRLAAREHARATARPARPSTRRSSRGRRSCRRSSRRSRLRSRRAAAALRARGAPRCSCAVWVVRSIGLAYTVEIVQRREPLGRGLGLLDALLGEIDAGHAAREQRTGVRGDAVPHEHEPRRRLRLRASRVRRRWPRFVAARVRPVAPWREPTGAPDRSPRSGRGIAISITRS